MFLILYTYLFYAKHAFLLVYVFSLHPHGRCLLEHPTRAFIKTNTSFNNHIFSSAHFHRFQLCLFDTYLSPSPNPNNNSSNNVFRWQVWWQVGWRVQVVVALVQGRSSV